MAYEKQTWQTGDVITADRLNHMEDGIAQNVLLVEVNATTNSGQTQYTCNKTWQQIHDAGMAFFQLQHPQIQNMQMIGFLSMIGGENNSYGLEVYTLNSGTAMALTTDNPNGYPQYTQGK